MQQDQPTCAPPRPLQRVPAYRPPAGAWDCHCHVFGPAASFPFAASRTYTPHDAGVAQLLALHDALGFDQAVLVQPAAHGTDHSALRDALARSGGSYRGVMLAEADGPDPDFTALHALGMRAVRFNLVPHLGPPPAWGFVRALAPRLAASGWHIVLHAGPEQIADLDDWTGLGVPLVLDHMGRIDARGGPGQPAVDALVERLGRADLFVKLSGIDRVSHAGAPFADALPIARRLFEAAPDRCLWGTDYPHPNHRAVPDDADLVDAIATIAPDAASRHLLLVETPLTLYR